MFTKSYIAIYSVVDVCVCVGVRAFVYMYGAVDDAVRVLLLFFSIKVSWPTENR